MADFWTSLSKWFDEKANSPLYWTYFAFLIVWNWKFFQIIFLEDSSLFTRPRVEYLSAFNLTPTNQVWFNWLLTAAWHILPPAILTYAAIVWLPRIHEWAFDIYTDNLFKRKMLFQRKKVEYEEEMAKLAKQEVVAKKATVKQRRTLEKTKTQEEKWEEEINPFASSAENFQAFSAAVRVAYKAGGEITTQANDADSYRNYISSQDLSRLDTWGLVEISKGRYSQKLVLTEKGKYFLKAMRQQNRI